jgi:predicted amidohydrolase
MASSPQEFFNRIQPPIERAAQAGAQLIVFPNYVGLMLLGIAAPTEHTSLALGEIARANKFETVADLLRASAPTMRSFYLRLFQSLAERAHVYLAAGTAIEWVGGRLFNTAYMFAPDGHIVGAQRQTHRTAREINWGLDQASELAVWDIGLARVGMIVGSDIAYPEVGRILVQQNANLLVHPAAYPAWNDDTLLLDLWRETQTHGVCGMQACAVGEFRGRSAVYAPGEMTRPRNGIVAQAPVADEEGIVTATFELPACPAPRDNRDVFARELVRVYRGV